MGEKKSGDEKKSANEGEGSRSGARAYNEATRAFVESGKVPSKAKGGQTRRRRARGGQSAASGTRGGSARQG